MSDFKKDYLSMFYYYLPGYPREIASWLAYRETYILHRRIRRVVPMS